VASDLVRNSDSAADAEQVKRAADEINRQLKDAAQSIRFSVDSGSGKTIVRVVDSETGDVIRQIPSEEVLAISRSIERMQGVLLHQKA
jgi:flagellar protein FlaG